MALLPDRLRTLVPGPNSLGRRALKGGGWTMAELAGGHALRLGGNLIMTRLLLPEAFGLMAMVFTLHYALGMMSDMGIRQSVVRHKRGEETVFLRTAWVAQAMRGGAIAALVVLAAGVLWLVAPSAAPEGTVYADPDLPALIALSAVTLLMWCLESTNQFLAMRRMAFGRVAAVNLSSQAVGLVAMVAIAQVEASAWALLWGAIIAGAVKLAASHVVFPGPRMTLTWDREISRELWVFGRWLLGSSALTFLSNQADRLILGALLDKEVFGFYVIAILWSEAAAAAIRELSAKIGFSSFSEIVRTRAHDTARLFRRFVSTIDLLCLAGFFGFLFLGPWLIDLLYTPQYAVSGAFLPLLALKFLHLRFMLFGNLLTSMGNSKVQMTASALRAVAICTALPIAFELFGLSGALLAKALAPIAAAPLLIAKCAPVLGRQVIFDAAWFVSVFMVAAAVYAVYG